ncbi:VTT domain-containing protein [Galbitalea soli]|uniref:Alkaline phosphatase n=1 Tax=Galbitalea soli TaxID=1268042 RepID=A0A7C9TN18_9MICO|nr:VTT domain-containing protein [Galbitalea soli]NEM90096.1 alkaline phosphatase [Galbitalea soli]NYJ30803.1 membrane-associated protein [Galbitalea soli]
MHSHLAILGGIFDPTALLTGAGPYALVAIALIVFIETGLLFPFLPGDSLVFTAALLSASLGIPLWLLMVVVAGSAILGDQVGYLIGRRLGRRLFRPEARVFKTAYLERANAFFDRYGPSALVLARFAPLLRTFVPPVVGSSTLRYRRFVVWNIAGGILWTVVLSLAGYWLGRIPLVANNVELFAIGIVILSLIPIVVGFLRRRGSATAR